VAPRLFRHSGDHIGTLGAGRAAAATAGFEKPARVTYSRRWIRHWRLGMGDLTKILLVLGTVLAGAYIAFASSDALVPKDISRVVGWLLIGAGAYLYHRNFLRA
jgi:hypothetical protein